MWSNAEISKARSLFADERSLGVLDSRLKFDQTQDVRHLFDLVEMTMKTCQDNRRNFTHNYELLDITRRILDAQGESTLIIFGIGLYAETALRLIYEYGLIASPKCRVVFADNNPSLWNKKYDHYNPEQRLDIISNEQLRQYVKGENVYVILPVATASSRESMRRQLEGYVSNIRIFETTNNYKYWIGNIYFEKEIMTAREDEIFLDIGAYDMANTKEFMAWAGDAYRRAIAFEADSVSYERCKKIIESEKMRNVELHNLAAYSKTAELAFECAPSGEHGGSRINELGSSTVKAVALDSIVDCATVIKMDIEGAEREALIGASSIMKKHRPRLAISAYHKPFDIVDLPLLIKEINPAYSQFYLRHHTCGLLDTVLYAL